jgi:opacity protein-like surface antigen
MKSLLLLMAIFVLTASASDISGTWKAAIETPNGALETTFKFKVDGNKLTGSTSNEFMGEALISDGKVDGDSLSFTVNASFNGNDVKLNYKGAVAGDEMKLTLEIPGRDRTIEMTAKRA